MLSVLQSENVPEFVSHPLIIALAEIQDVASVQLYIINCRTAGIELPDH